MKANPAILNNAKAAEREAISRLCDNYKINDAEFAYSPSTFAVGIRWDETQTFKVFNIHYPMYGRNDQVNDWVSVGKGHINA